jgi:hypothetical protein
MPDEAFEKFKDFMLQSQAQAEVRLSKVEERMDSLIGIVSDLANATLNYFNSLEDKVVMLVDAQIKTEERVSDLADKMKELAEAQAHTDKRLDALIDIVREGRNGKP